LKRAAEHLRNTSHAAVGTTIKRKIIKRLENASKHAAATATQCIAASQTAEKFNQNTVIQVRGSTSAPPLFDLLNHLISTFIIKDELLDNCKVVAEVIPRLIEGVKSSMQNPDSALAQLNLINTCEQFLDPSKRYPCV
jgi:talin